MSAERRTFSLDPTLSRDAFISQLSASLREFSQIRTAEFQITKVDRGPGARLKTRVRYELAGAGTGVYREQRIGYWELEWSMNSGAPWQVERWTFDEETISRAAAPIFEDVSERVLGSTASYRNQLLRGVDHWRTAMDGATGIDIYGHNGVSVGDIDGDGFDDVYVCQPAGLPNRLYRNRGDGTFEDITEQAGVGVLDNTACALFADVENAGRQDLIVVRASGPLLFINDGAGKFRLKPDAFQFAAPPQGTFTGAAIADYDRDGWLDIYFCLYVFYQGTGQYKYPTPYYDAENGPPNFLLKNNRDGTFRDATAATGLNRNNTRFSFCCGWNDYNGDGWPDLYVVNDFGRKNLYRNNGDGTFSDVAAAAGVEDVGAGMSVAWFDYDNDGLEDLYVADMWTAAGERISSDAAFQKDAPEQVRGLYRKHAMGNSLFKNGNGFRDVTAPAGVGIGRWAWSSDAWDFDHDGFADLYVTNGMVSGPRREDLNSFFWRQVVAKSPGAARTSSDYEQGWNAVNELLRADYSWSGYERNVFFRNNGDGTFTDISAVAGLDFIEDGRAFALADFDQDGRQEIFLKNRNAPQVRVLKNVMADLPPSISFRLRGTKSNRDGIGAVIMLVTDTGRQARTLQAGSGFLSQHSKEIFFGLGQAKGAVSAEIRWPSGLVQKLTGLPLNHRISVEEGSAGFRAEAFRAEAFRAAPSVTGASGKPEPLEQTSETWLLVPVTAPDFVDLGSGRRLSSLRGQPVLLRFSEDLSGIKTGGPLVHLNVKAEDTDDTVAIYNILYRWLFDRHRDLSLPTSFLIDEDSKIVKVYQGAVDASRAEDDARNIPRTAAARLVRALPFPGVAGTYAYGRNYLSSGSLYFQRGYYEQAGSSFRMAVQEDPSSAEASYGLGSVYLKQKKMPEARASFEEAVRQTASYPDTMANAWNNLGLLAAQDRGPEAAIQCFEKALDASPDHFVALENLGSAYRQAQRWDDARRVLARALTLRPDDAEANYSMGMVFAQTNDTARANEYLMRALKANPTYPEALNNLGILYLRTGRRDAAVAKFEECMQAAPDFAQAYVSLARVYKIEGAPGKEKTVLQELLKRHPEDAQAREELERLR
jgi:tetratricopeptide (TPR) repeat protein